MTKQTAEEKKIAEGKKASKVANKKKANNKVNAAAKKLSDKALLDMADTMPAGQGNAFCQLNIKMDKIDEQQAVINRAKRDVRNEFKAIKTDMRALDRVRKLRKMDIEDMRATKATEALYERQLGMELSTEQQALITDIQLKRENAAAAMSELNGGETGKEVGTGMIGHNTAANGADVNAGAPKAPALPERNEGIGKGFRPAEPATTIAH